MIDLTRGPWNYIELNGKRPQQRFIVAAPDAGLPTRSNQGASLILARPGTHGTVADLRAMAAAPELLEAAQLALRLIRDTWISDHGSESVGRAWGALQGAIEKATGVSP